MLNVFVGKAKTSQNQGISDENLRDDSNILSQNKESKGASTGKISQPSVILILCLENTGLFVDNQPFFSYLFYVFRIILLWQC